MSGSTMSRRAFLASAAVGFAAAPALARIDGVQIGVCSKCANFPKIREYGFDYLEPPATQVAEMSQAEFESFREQVFATPVRCECFNDFITLRVVGDHVDPVALRNYLEHTLSRCRELGGSIVVWGSSRSRNVPPGFSRAQAWKQIQSFLRLADEAARPKGIVIAIEPLRIQESNIINTGAEALRLVHEVNRPNVRMIIDYYHMRVMNEDPEIVWRARKDIVHFHFANPHGRLWPKIPAEDPEYGRFFDLVEKIEFTGGISIEAHGSFEKDARSSLAFFREELDAAQKANRRAAGGLFKRFVTRDELRRRDSIVAAQRLGFGPPTPDARAPSDGRRPSFCLTFRLPERILGNLTRLNGVRGGSDTQSSPCQRTKRC